MRRFGPRIRPPARRAVVIILAIGVACGLARPARVAARDDDERVSARAEVGAEFDDNVHRLERIPGVAGSPVASALARGVFGWSVYDRPAAAQEVAFSLLGAGKLFEAPAARNENVAIVDTSGSWRIATDRRGKLGLGATYYEAIQAGTETERALSMEARDFRSLVPSLRALRYLGDSASLSVLLGYRWFVYKPFRSYDFQAPVISLEYRLGRETADGEADWELLAAIGAELRNFAGDRLLPAVAGCTPPDPCVAYVDPTGARHVDQFFSGQLDVTRTGRVLVGAGYALQWNRSNSYGESLLRHVGTIRFTTPLPLGLYLAARAELVYVTYPDKITLAYGPSAQSNYTIEDETRSQVRAELSRDLRPHLQVMARYSFYANALGQGANYRRQTATLSLVYTTE